MCADCLHQKTKKLFLLRNKKELYQHEESLKEEYVLNEEEKEEEEEQLLQKYNDYLPILNYLAYSKQREQKLKNMIENIIYLLKTKISKKMQQDQQYKILHNKILSLLLHSHESEVLDNYLYGLLLDQEQQSPQE